MTDPQEFGYLKAEVAHLKKTVEEMSEDIKVMRTILDKKDGGTRLLLTIISVSATIGGILGSVLTFWKGL